MVPWWIGLAVIGGDVVLSALLFGRARWLAALVAASSLSVPFLVRGGPSIAVTSCALLCVLAPIRVFQLLFDPTPRAAAFRVWFVAMPFDARKARVVAPGLDRAAVVALLANAAIGAVGLLAVFWIDAHLHGHVARGARVVAGIFGVYGGASAVAALYVVGHRLVGVQTPTIMQAPILARSIAEFWSRRWNRAVHELLRGAFFAPLARRGFPRTGVFAAFFGSALLHAWIVVFSLGAWPALIMASFFLMQGVLALVEDRLRVRRWRPAFAHAWTLAAFALTSPLFVEPYLKALGI